MAIFSRQHYQAIAEVIAAFKIDYSEPPTEIELVARAFAVMFLADNEEFNSKRFLKVCGMEE